MLKCDCIFYHEIKHEWSETQKNIYETIKNSQTVKLHDWVGKKGPDVVLAIAYVFARLGNLVLIVDDNEEAMANMFREIKQYECRKRMYLMHSIEYEGDGVICIRRFDQLKYMRRNPTLLIATKKFENENFDLEERNTICLFY
jgi:hypothetical protein